VQPLRYGESAPSGVLPEDLVLLTEDVPKRYGPYITPRMAHTMGFRRVLRTWKIGGRLYVSAADVEAWLAGHESPAREGATL
jgi:hypothetical protein